MRHKHADLIKAWADGAEIQHLQVSGEVWIDSPTPVWHEMGHYRIKPGVKILKYRRYISSACFGSVPSVFCWQYDTKEAYNPEHERGFICWIDKDWIESPPLPIEN